MSYRIQEFYAPPPPPPQPQRVFCQKKGSSKVEAFDVDSSRDTAIEAVRHEGYERALVVIK